MNSAQSTAFDLLTGRWRSQILHAGVKLGILEHLAGGRSSAVRVAEDLSLDPGNGYRLMRALASIGLLEEDAERNFALTAAGELFCADHPHSLRGVCLWEEGQAMYAAWRHLPDVVRDGGADGFRREFGAPLFAQITADAALGLLFNEAMTSYSQAETGQVLAALEPADLSSLQHVCDIGGGRGHLLCHFLQRHPHVRGTVFDLPETFADPGVLLANTMGLSGRCRHEAGDMFAAAPAADGYFLKHILHDWNDDECIRILGAAGRAANPGARVFVAEYLVPGPERPDFAKLFDIHMMSVLTGRERTEAEYAGLLQAAGWRHTRTWTQPESSMSVIEGARP